MYFANVSQKIMKFQQNLVESGKLIKILQNLDFAEFKIQQNSADVEEMLRNFAKLS